jgi:A/G-specific adenine glycosylase
VKEKKLKRRNRYFHFLVVSDRKGNTIIEQRGEGDIWQALYQFPLIEVDRDGLTTEELPQQDGWPEWLLADKLAFTRRSPPLKQQLTHQSIIAVFHHFTHPKLPDETKGKQVVKNKMFKVFAFPRVITKYLADKTLLLDLF